MNMELPKSIRFSSIISDPEAYIQEMFQLHPDAEHHAHFGEIEIKNGIIDSSFRYQLLEDGLFLFAFSSFSPIDAEYEFIPNPNADYFTLVFYFTENRSKNPLYLKINEKFYSSDQISMFFNGRMNAEIFIKANHKAHGIRIDIHKKWFNNHIDIRDLQKFSELKSIIEFETKGQISTDCEKYSNAITDILNVFKQEEKAFQKIHLIHQTLQLITEYLADSFSNSILPEVKNANFGQLKSALNYLEKNTAKEFPGSDFLADLCNISESTFIKKFKNHFHTTAAHYFRNLKMKEALNLLQLGHTVKEVAHKLDYKDVSAFGRSFKQIYGRSPASYVKI